MQAILNLLYELQPACLQFNESERIKAPERERERERERVKVIKIARGNTTSQKIALH